MSLLLAAAVLGQQGGVAPTLVFVGTAGPTNENNAVQTISGANLGDDSVERSIIVAIGNRVANGGVLSSVSIAGVAATIDAKNLTNTAAAIARAVIPAGVATGDIVATYPSNNWNMWASVYSAPTGLTVVDSAVDYLGSGTSLSGTVSTSSGFLVASAAITTTTTWTWTNATEDADRNNASASASTASVVTSGSSVVVDAVAAASGSFAGLAVVSYG